MPTKISKITNIKTGDMYIRLNDIKCLLLEDISVYSDSIPTSEAIREYILELNERLSSLEDRK